MNYSQYIKLQESTGETELNEILTPLIIGGAVTTGLAWLFQKDIMSSALKKFYKNKLNNIAEDFRKSVSDVVDKTVKIYKDNLKQLKKIEGSSEQNRQLEKLQQTIINLIIDSINRLTEIKNRQVFDIIDKSTKLKNTAKEALKFYWETLTSDIKVNALSSLTVKHMMISSVVKSKIKNYSELQKIQIEKKAKSVQDKLNDYSEIEEEPVSKESTKKYSDETDYNKAYYKKQINKTLNKIEIEEDSDERNRLKDELQNTLDNAKDDLTDNSYNTLFNEIPELEKYKEEIAINSFDDLSGIEGYRELKW